jgi:hypothetical protein
MVQNNGCNVCDIWGSNVKRIVPPFSFATLMAGID